MNDNFIGFANTANRASFMPFAKRIITASNIGNNLFNTSFLHFMEKKLFFLTRFFAAWPLALGLCAIFAAVPINLAEAQSPFIITVKTDNPGASNSTSFTIPTNGVDAYNYEVDWDNDGIYDESGLTGDATHDYGTAGTYTLRIRGTFPQILFSWSNDPHKLLDVNQWGDNPWTSMAFSFLDCQNLNITATDLPNLSNVTDMSFMFFSCYVLNGPSNIGDWDLSNVENISGMFFNCLAFNQPIENWNIANVTNMSALFAAAIAFNQPVNSWNTANVTDMSGVFTGATAFNQPLDNWNTANATSMYGMFWDATSFNQPIGNWNTANVGDYGMFGMFFNAAAFNQPIGNWNTAHVTSMTWMFNGAASFNQPIGNWNLSAVTGMEEMLDNSGMDCLNYSISLSGWANNPATPSGLTLGAAGRQYGTNVAVARDILTGAKGWTINGDAASAGVCAIPRQPNEFVITVKTDNPGASNSTSFTIPTNGVDAYNYEVDWNDDGIYDESGLTGDATHDYGVAGTYTLRIRGTFPQISFSWFNDPHKLLDVNQWGDNPWASMAFSFLDCQNLNITATDLPNLSNVTDMSFMFFSCYVLNGPSNIGDWDISNVENISGMFFNCLAFNQPIENWNTAKVTNMSNLFAAAIAFNQPVNSWNTANVTDMGGVFTGATAFNQPLDNWNTSNATSMYGMFWDATSFNQPIGNWNTAKVGDYGMFGMFFNAAAFNQPIGNWNTAHVTSMTWMFNGATSFNQSIGNWNLSAVTGMEEMLDNSGMDCTNYSATLSGWANNPATPSGLTLGAAGRQYGTNAASARNTLTGTKGWIISGDAASGVACACSAPNFTACPTGPITMAANSQCKAVVNYSALATGVSTPTLNFSFAGATNVGNSNGTGSGSAFEKGSTTVTVKASNACGVANCVFTVNVVDNTAPNITCPASIVRGTDPTICGAVVQYANPTYSDNCSGAGLDHISGGLSGSTFPRGTTTVRWMVTDAANNTKTCTFRITVNDTQAPTITCPTVSVQNAGAGQCSATVAYPTPTAVDNCTASPTVTRIGGPTSGSIFPVGTTYVTWRAIDGAGRSSTCSFAVAVADNQAPTVICPQNIVQNNPANACNAPVFYNNPTATDNCGVNSVYLASGMASGSSFPVGATTVVWRANDANGLSATCSFTVTVACGSGAQTIFERGNDLSQVGTNLSLALSPNPAMGAVTATIDGLGKADGELLVLDGLGRLLLRQTVAEGQVVERFDVSGWAVGVYQVCLKTKDRLISKSLVVGRW